MLRGNKNMNSFFNTIRSGLMLLTVLALAACDSAPDGAGACGGSG